MLKRHAVSQAVSPKVGVTPSAIPTVYIASAVFVPCRQLREIAVGKLEIATVNGIELRDVRLDLVGR